MAEKRRPRIVILGGGFAGAYVAKHLADRNLSFDAEVIVIDRNNYFVFYPLLVEAGTGALEPRHCTVPIREFSRKSELLMGEIKGLDTKANKVRLQLCGDDRDRELEYDHLVVALGSVTRIFPEDVCSGVQEHAFEVKHMSDAIALRDRAVELLELANACDDPEERKRLLHFIVVGGNVTGIEVVGELEVFVRGATSMYANIKPSDCQFTVIELAPKILSILPDNLIRWATKTMTGRGIELRTGESVKEVHADHVITSNDERISCSTVIWTAGIAPNPVLKEFTDLPLNSHAGVDCEPTYQVKGYDNVWALGDCAGVPGPSGKPMPPLAQIAIRQAKQLAHNIAAAHRGEALTPGDVSVLGILVPLGHHKGVMEFKGIKVEGFMAWAMWRAIYLSKMPGFGRKIRVLLDWIINFFFRRDYVQLGMNPAASREFTSSKK
ncbi:MAG: NAD(P)/FAD-dependent oxidoreductase [Phycisphaerales bacterium]|nr:NAD(P)/FAD-dependent oxidoreductase [Phycisphaerales bacterium]